MKVQGRNRRGYDHLPKGIQLPKQVLARRVARAEFGRAPVGTRSVSPWVSRRRVTTLSTHVMIAHIGCR